MKIIRLICSDIHAGLAVSRHTDLVAEIIKQWPIHLILIGDLVDSAPYLPVDVWLNALEKLSKEMEIWWIRGNHDWDSAPILAEKIGVHCLDRYYWDDANGRNMAIHGHQYDQFVEGHPEITQIATEFYADLQRVTGVTIAEALKAASKVFSRDAEALRDGAFDLAKEMAMDNIWMGHIHRFDYVQENHTTYRNDSCCCLEVASYFTVRHDGFVEKHDF